MRYNHHSTLLYAVPPSSVGCLDLLVGLYGWVGSQISHVPGRRADTHALEVDEFTGAVTASPARPGNETPTQRGRQLAQMETPVRILTRDDKSARSSVDAVARTLAQSLGHLHEVRGDLLAGWAERDKQTTLLEDNTRQLAEGVPEASRLHLPAVEPAAKLGAKDKPRKMHRVGGKIRGLFSSSSTNTTAANSGTGGNLPTLAERAPPVSSANANRRSVDLTRPIPKSRALATPPVASSGSRPSSRQRHSVQVAQGAYRSPFNPAETSPDPSSERSTALAEATAKLNGVSISITGVGGVGGLNGEGDEDEQREQVGRKKEGVLWGTGTWEDLDKGGFKGKWERKYEHRVEEGCGLWTVLMTRLLGRTRPLQDLRVPRQQPRRVKRDCHRPQVRERARGPRDGPALRV